MTIRGFRRNFKPLEILTEEQVEAIHSGALDVLRVTGARIEHDKALKLLEKNGCEVDYDEKRVRFPEYLVEESLRKAPSSFRWKARDPKNDIVHGANAVYFAPFPGMDTVDLDTWERRRPTKQEYIDGVKVLDALDNVHGFGNYTPYFGFEGVPPVMGIPEGFATKIANTSKAINMEGSLMESEIFTMKIARAAGSEFMGTVVGSAPLTYYSDQIEALFRYAEAGFPFWTGHGGHVMGGSGPATVAGAVVLDLAGDMAGYVLTQLVKPGAAMAQGSFTFPMEMRGGSPFFGAIGISLHHAARIQVGRKYDIPFWAVAPGACSSKRPDFQSGYEKAIAALTAALCGANLVAIQGSVFGELTHHPVQAILDDDVAGMLGRFLEGIGVNDETLALDLIEEVGPIPGHYLGTEHTREWWAKEQFVPKVADRLTYPEWMAKGKKGALDYAKERMEEILATHKPTPLTASQEQEIERILEEARKYYREKGLM